MAARALPLRVTERRSPEVTVHERIGNGGMGELWRVTRPLGKTGQRAVLKRPRTDLLGDAAKNLLQRFEDEVSAMAALDHGNIVRLLDAGHDADGPWALMEYVDGTDALALARSLSRAKERDPSVTLGPLALAWLAHEVARGLMVAHALPGSPILHRDLSPANVLLARDGSVKLTDFGIAVTPERARQTTTGVVVGNLQFIAPEQLEGRPLSPATDVYGIGRLMEEFVPLLDGNVAVREALVQLSERATARDPAQRPATASAFVDALLQSAPDLALGRVMLARAVEALVEAQSRTKLAMASLLGESTESAPATGEVAVMTHDPPPELADTVRARRSLPPAPKPRPRWPWAVAAGAVAAIALGVGFRAKPSQREPATTPVAHASTTVIPPPPTPVAAPEPTLVIATDAGAPVVAEAPRVRVASRALVAALHVPRPAPAPSPAAPIAEAPTGVLRVSTLPRSRVRVDDGPLHQAPHDFTVPAGQHTVYALFEAIGERPPQTVTRVVTVAPGRSEPVGITP